MEARITTPTPRVMLKASAARYTQAMRRPLACLIVATALLVLPIVLPTQAQGSFRIVLPSILRAGTGIVGPEHSGDGTYYDATGDGNCMFGPSPNDMMVAAMNHTDYNAAAMCGAYVQATGPKGTVLVRIVDRCPECPAGDVDFSREAFAVIADLPQGRVPITWRLASPEVTGPIAYRIKEGSSQWWTAIQVRNHRNPIASLEYKAANGQFVTVPRMDYNYFVQSSGMGVGPYTFRVTDTYGNVLVDTGIPLSVGVVLPGAGQFPQAP